MLSWKDSDLTQLQQNLKSINEAFSNLRIADSQSDIMVLKGIMLKLNAQIRTIRVQRLKEDSELKEIFKSKLSSRIQIVAATIKDDSFINFIQRLYTQIGGINDIRNANCSSFYKDLTVDHRYIPFVMIAKSFIDTEPNIEITNDNKGIGWVIKDPNILKAWQHFHEERANYQILCRSCNSTKGKKDDTKKRQA